MKQKYKIIFLTIISSLYIYKNFIWKQTIDNSTQTEESYKPKELNSIQKLARKGGIVENFLKLEKLNDKEDKKLDEDIILKLEPESDSEIISESGEESKDDKKGVLSLEFLLI